MNRDELKKAYPIGSTFIDQFGHSCIVRGYQATSWGRMQIVADVTHVWDDGYSEVCRCRYFPGVLPANKVLQPTTDRA